MRRPMVGRSSPDSLYAAPQVNAVGRRSVDSRATVGRSPADRKTLQLIKVIGEVCFNVIQQLATKTIYWPKTGTILVGRLSVLM